MSARLPLKWIILELRVANKVLDRNEHELAGEALLAFPDFLLQRIRVDRTFIHIEERHIVVEHLVEENDKFHKIGVGLLPERLFPFSEEVVQQGSNPVCQRVGVELAIEW